MFKKFDGNYVYYGVREFGMSSIMNGIALHQGFIPYGGTFLTFLDYARNAVRLSAMMKIRVIYVYTHDSIGLGEDGPTHQPVEHINMLRSTPNMSLWRPCDATESFVAWSQAIKRQTGPTSLLFTRQTLPHQPKTKKQVRLIERGAYVLVDVALEAEEALDAILIATGSEVSLAVSAATLLSQEGLKIRVVSMPSTDVFKAQDLAYQQSVLPPSIKARIAIEAGSTYYWYQWVGSEGAVIGLDRYGESAPGSIVFEALGFTVENVVATVKQVLDKQRVFA